MNIFSKFMGLSTKVKAIIIAAIAVLAVGAVVLGLVLTGGDGGTKDNSGASSTPLSSSENGEVADYSLTLKAEDGLCLEGITLEVYKDEAKNDLLNVIKTDKEGKASFSGTKGGTYYLVIVNAPENYIIDQLYTISEEQTEIVLKIALAGEDDWQGSTFGLGDIMFDFTVKDTEGTNHSLSALLKSHDAVVLNFWYTNCEPCKSEFPYLDEAYDSYKDKIALIALNPVDDNDAVAAFKSEKGLSLTMAAVESDWEKAFKITGYPTTVVINKNGRIAFIHNEPFKNATQVKDMFKHFLSEDYKGEVVEDNESIFTESQDPEGVQNPKEVFGVSELELTVKPGETEYCDLYRVTGKYLQLNAQDVVVIVDDKRYTPVNGAISVYLEKDSNFLPIKLGVVNESEEVKTFKFTLGFPKGTSDNPNTLTPGQLTVPVNAGNDQGVFYVYTATENGTLAMEFISGTGGHKSRFVLYNLTKTIYRTNEEDGEKSESGNELVTVPVSKGDRVQVSVSVDATGNNFPAATFVFNVAFTAGGSNTEEKPVVTTDYKVTVKDNTGTPLQGIFVKFNTDSAPITMYTDENGVAATTLPEGVYKVEVTPLPGYKVDSPSFELSKDKAEKTVVVSLIEKPKADYTVILKNEDGTPVPNVFVSVGTVLATTDAEGKAVFNLEVADNYTAFVSLPDGYVTETSLAFGTGKVINVTVKKEEKPPVDDSSEEKPPVDDSSTEQPPVDEKAEYKVIVVDTEGKPCTGAAVLFTKDGAQVAMVQLNAQGVATAKLDKGNYGADIVFPQGAELYYDKKGVSLTAEKTSTTVVAAPKIENKFLSLYKGNSYVLTEGGYYAELTNFSEDGVCLFSFTPDVSGLYSFRIIGVGTEISYWGGNIDFMFDNTDALNIIDGSFTLNVKDSNLGSTYTIGVKGAEGCIIVTKRQGDFIPDEHDIPPVIYTPDVAPKPFTLNLGVGQSIVHFDLSKPTGDYKLVYSEKDGYYHLGNENGAIVYLNMGEDAPYISIASIVTAAGMGKYFYDEDGSFIKREDYTECVQAYSACIDENHGLYPLTDDLIYIIQNHGEYVGWWQEDHPGFIFQSVENLNAEIGWMFALCYIA